MSVSLWAYSPQKCDGNVCVGDCDLCSKADEAEKCIDPVEVEKISEIEFFEDLGEGNRSPYRREQT